jgi:hypothetical protein
MHAERKIPLKRENDQLVGIFAERREDIINDDIDFSLAKPERRLRMQPAMRAGRFC